MLNCPKMRVTTPLAHGSICPFRFPWATWAHMGAHGPHGPIWALMGPWATWAHMGLHGPICVLLGPWATWDHMGPSGPCWAYLGLHLWAHIIGPKMAPKMIPKGTQIGSKWIHNGTRMGPKLAQIYPHGPKRTQMGRPGARVEGAQAVFVKRQYVFSKEHTCIYQEF